MLQFHIIFIDAKINKNESKIQRYFANNPPDIPTGKSRGSEGFYAAFKLYMTESRVGEAGRELDTGVCEVSGLTLACQLFRSP